MKIERNFRLIEALEGLVRFFSELLPVVWRLLFVSSPLLLATVLAYFIAGTIPAVISFLIMAALLVAGAAWSRHFQPDRSTAITWRVFVAVMALNLLVIGGSFLAGQWKKSRVSRQASMVAGKDGISKKAEVFANAVGDALAMNMTGYDERSRYFKVALLKRSLAELRAMRALDAVPDDYVKSTLAHCRTKVEEDRGPGKEQCEEIAPIMIKLAVDARMESACEILYKVQTDGGKLEAEARAATAKLCGE